MARVNHFRVYRNWMRVFENMSHEQTGRVFEALMIYAFEGDDVVATSDEYEPQERAAFYALAASIDVAAEKYGTANK